MPPVLCSVTVSGVVGNEQADALGTNGRLANPLYPAADTPKGGAARVCTTPQRQPWPAPASPSYPEVISAVGMIRSIRVIGWMHGCMETVGPPPRSARRDKPERVRDGLGSGGGSRLGRQELPSPFVLQASLGCQAA